MPICNSNLALAGHFGITLAWPRSQSVLAALPREWWKFLMPNMKKQIFQPIVREICSRLQGFDRDKLLSVLHKFELLFDGTLGDWNLLPVSFEVDEGMKPYHGRPYPIMHKHKAVLMKEIKQLCNIGVLMWQPSLRWASPIFIIPKTDSTVCTISNFRELNKRIVIKFCPICKISMML